VKNSARVHLGQPSSAMKNLVRFANRKLRGHPYLFDKARELYGLLAMERYGLHQPLEQALNCLAKNPCMIQLGASDGLVNDPYRPFIVKYKWRAVLVEPIPESFAALQRNYAPYARGGHLTLENAAVSYGGATSARLYRYSNAYICRAEASRRTELLQKTSFDPLHLSRWDAQLDASKDIESFDIPAVTVEALAKKHLSGRCDILAMDLEGYEANVLLNLDLSAIKPSLIIFEAEHIAQADWDAIRARLIPHGYELAQHGADAIAKLV
jgi:FkbM family methyltransferase